MRKNVQFLSVKPVGASSKEFYKVKIFIRIRESKAIVTWSGKEVICSENGMFKKIENYQRK